MANYDFTMEQLQAAKAAKSPEELVAKAKERGYEISLERAAAFLKPDGEVSEAQVGEIADEELDNVAGGGCGSYPQRPEKCPMCKSKNIKAVEYEQGFASYWSCSCKACGHKWNVKP